MMTVVPVKLDRHPMRWRPPGHDEGMSQSPSGPVERGELLMPGPPSPSRQDGREERPETEAVESPAKVMRIGTMVKQLLDEVRAAPLDERSRERLTRIYQTSVTELADALSPDLQAELR